MTTPNTTSTRRLPALAIAVLVGIAALPLSAAEIVIESAAFNDPKFDPPPATKSFHPRLKALWLEALARPEADYKREAADAIARGQSLGMPGLEETIKPLTSELANPTQSALVKLAVARALIGLDARDAADTLQKVAVTDGGEFAELIEPALTRWKHEPMRQVWLDRLSSENPPRGLLLLAIQGLAEWKESQAAGKLLELAVGSASPSVRLEAARALGRVKSEGLLDEARKLASDKTPPKILDRLVAASMLAGHSGSETEAFLAELSVDPEPAVAAIALRRLFELKPDGVLALLDKISTSPDANVRHFAVKALIARPSPERIEKLSAFLDDDDTAVRVAARDGLFTFAADEQYKDLVVRKAVEMLAGKRWRGLEQSAILLGALDHEPAAERLVQLLEFEQPQVYVAAAWALRKIQVSSALPGMFDRGKKVTELLANSRQLTITNAPTDMLNAQMRELLQAFGLMRYPRGAELLVRYVPKGSPYELNTRCAAIWAGGLLLEGLPDSEITKTATRELIARLSDVGGPNPEDERVRRMAAVSLGRMKAENALPKLREFYGQGQTNRIVGYACAWAIRQITGEDVPDPPIPDFPETGWFLEPLD